MAGALAVIGTIASIGGTVLSAVGAIQQGKYQQATAEAQAKAEERRAQEEQAGAQREAIRRGREARYVLSRQLAVSASSGGSASDSTVLNLMANTAREGDYQSQSAVYEGTMRGQGLQYQAGIDRMAGQQARTAGYINAGSSILGGIASFAKYRYG